VYCGVQKSTSEYGGVLVSDYHTCRSRVVAASHPFVYNHSHYDTNRFATTFHEIPRDPIMHVHVTQINLPQHEMIICWVMNDR